MRGDLFNGWVTLAGDFPASVNTDSDPTRLKPFESPSCYGTDCQATGYLKTGSILTGTARTATTKTIGGTAYNWYYDRVWRVNTAPNDYELVFGARYYDDVYHVQGRGKVEAEADIITFMPAFGNDMWIVTASGSQILSNARSAEGQFVMGQFFQEAYTSDATYATTANGIPHFTNVDGVFSWNGQSLKELTRPVRTSLGQFTNKALTVDYSERFLIGASAFVIDLESEKLFDYGTSGFLFTSRTLTDAEYKPLQIDALAIDLEYASEGNDILKWEVKWEDGNWEEQEDIVLRGEQGERSHVERPINNQQLARKFAMRITSLPSFVKIRSIKTMVRSFAQETPSE